MKMRKTVLKFFTIADWEEEAQYLSQMHGAGWKLERVGGLCVYHFVKCQPENVVYQLDYNPDRAGDSDEYIQLFRDCGWEYLQDYLGYSYFRKAAACMNGDERIFCDDASRLSMLSKIFSRRMIPLMLLFLLVLLPCTVINAMKGEVVNAMLIAGVLLLYLSVFVKIGTAFWKLRQDR